MPIQIQHSFYVHINYNIVFNSFTIPSPAFREHIYSPDCLAGLSIQLFTFTLQNMVILDTQNMSSKHILHFNLEMSTDLLL